MFKSTISVEIAIDNKYILSSPTFSWSSLVSEALFLFLTANIRSTFVESIFNPPNFWNSDIWTSNILESLLFTQVVSLSLFKNGKFMIKTEMMILLLYYKQVSCARYSHKYLRSSFYKQYLSPYWFLNINNIRWVNKWSDY